MAFQKYVPPQSSSFSNHPSRLSLILLLACVSLISANAVDKEEELYIIRSAPSGLVLDADDPMQIKIQHYTGQRSQLFKFVRGRVAGLFHIVNNDTG